MQLPRTSRLAQAQGFIAATRVKLAGKVTAVTARDMVIRRSSSG